MIRLARLAALAAPAVVLLIAAVATPLAEFATNQGDVVYYLERGRAVAEGLVPFRDFPLEYPPLALLPMVAPFLIARDAALDIDHYRWLFAGGQAILLVILGVALARIRRIEDEAAGRVAGGPFRFGVGGRLTVLSVGAALALAWRFDLLPATLATLGVWAGIAKRPARAGFALGLGALAKLYPIVLAPALAAAFWRRGDRHRVWILGGALTLTVQLGLLPFVSVAGPAAFTFLAYQVDRGLQIESVGGGLAVLAGLIGGSPPELSFGFSAVQVEGPLAGAFLVALPMLTVLGFGVVGWLGWRRIQADLAPRGAAGGAVRPQTVVAVAFASLLIVLVTSKVFSIQYVVWMVPFVALTEGRRFWLGAAIVALTMPIHPLLYAELVRQEALPILVLNVRNSLLVVLAVWQIVSLRPSRPIVVG